MGSDHRGDGAGTPLVQQVVVHFPGPATHQEERQGRGRTGARAPGQGGERKTHQGEGKQGRGKGGPNQGCRHRRCTPRGETYGGGRGGQGHRGERRTEERREWRPEVRSTQRGRRG